MKTQVISFHYTVTNKSGEKIDSSAGQEPLSFLSDQGQILPHLEVELTKLKVGDKKTVDLTAANAYGEFDQNLIIKVPNAELPSDGEVQEGARFRGQDNQGQDRVFTVAKRDDTHTTLDGNHPLAGQDLKFEVELVSIREATAEELEHGHAHDGDGHHHH
jgi:FKBP-type peptidyl-prolyl cis-trans isomerase SlyD